MNTNPYDVLVLGLKAQGLFLLQEYAKTNMKIGGIGFKRDIGLRSKFGPKICISHFNELDYIISQLCSRQTKLVITSDAFINYFVDEMPWIFQTNVCFPNHRSALIFRDKLLTYHFATERGIETLPTHQLHNVNPWTYDEFPSIIKWNKRYKSSEEFKTVVVRSAKELANFQNRNRETENLIVQSYIAGEPCCDLSYGGFLLNGEPVVEVVISQKRQYPYPNGLASFVEEYTGPLRGKIIDVARVLLKAIRYDGFVEVECRVDGSKDTLYLIEVNPRACGWIKVIKKKFPDFDVSLVEKSYEASKKTVSWVNLFRDLLAVTSYIYSTNDVKSLREVLSDYCYGPILDIFDSNDLRPFLWQLFYSFSIRS
jgi:predicted ATP-grasp superfamily ATP-dependent carboligase